MSLITRRDESCHTWKLFMSPMTRIISMNAKSGLAAISGTYHQFGKHRAESRHTSEGVMSHIGMGHVALSNRSCYTLE